jgi:RNA polymerase sigma factor (sigma-70 family)
MSTVSDPDFELFRNDPHALLLSVQGLVGSIVRIYIESGMFPLSEKADIVQSVNLELLERIPAIRENYNGSALLRTYLTAIVRNICLRLAQRAAQRRRRIQTVPDDLEDPSMQVDRYSIEQVRVIFRAVVRQFGEQSPKLVICLKLRYRQPLYRPDIVDWWPNCRKRDLNKILAIFGGNYEKLTDKQVYTRATPMFNVVEGRINGEDALRKWTAEKIDEILGILNTTYPEAAFGEDVLGLLFEDSVSPFLLKD